MARGRTRGGGEDSSFWPGFIDAFATLLLIIIFLLTIFLVAQVFLNQILSGKDDALTKLETQLAELSALLSLEKDQSAELQAKLERMVATLAETEERARTAEAEVDRLTGLLGGDGLGGEGEIASLKSALEEERAISSRARAELALLNQQLSALRAQLASLQAALDAAEARDKENKAVIADLGKRLNAALAQKVQELAKYRSEFFGRLREVLGSRSDVEIVGDRFVFQSEVLFDSGSADISPAGKTELRKMAGALDTLSKEIPDDLNWVLRVDGHTDARPINTPEFPSNWHLSAARAIAVVRYLVEQGAPPERLVAAGFGEFQPLDPARSQAAYKRNRRIEFKLTER